MKIYLGNSNVLIRIMSNVPDTVHAYENDIPERVGNFTDSQARKEVMLEKFMHHTDQAVSLLLKAYPLPLVLMATERTAGHFKKTASCSSHIMSYIHGNFDDAADGVLQAALFQTLEEWKISRQLYLLSRLNTAMNAGRLAIGIGQVLKEACMQKGQLLLVEKNYTFPAGTTARPKLSDQPFYITDTVDRVIEKVLESGGDVEFVDHGRLKAYRSIALVKYY